MRSMFLACIAQNEWVEVGELLTPLTLTHFIWRNACREPGPHDITCLYNTLILGTLVNCNSNRIRVLFAIVIKIW